MNPSLCLCISGIKYIMYYIIYNKNYNTKKGLVIESQCDIDVTGRNSRDKRERVKVITWSPGTFLFGTVLQTS
jgi:hypothetical protein